METYSALEVMKGLVFDWPRFRRLLARELRLSFGLNLPPMWFLIPHFFKVFCKTVLAVSTEFLCVFSLSAEFPVCFSRVSFVYEHEVYIAKEIRSTFVYQILVHYDEEI